MAAHRALALIAGTIERLPAGDDLLLTGPLDANGNVISGGLAAVNEQSGTTYTLVPEDSGKIVVLDNAADVSLNLPDDLAAGFNCLLLQGGAGAILPTTLGGATMVNRQGHTQSAGAGAMLTLMIRANTGNAAAYYLGGDTV